MRRWQSGSGAGSGLEIFGKVDVHADDAGFARAQADSVGNRHADVARRHGYVGTGDVVALILADVHEVVLRALIATGRSGAEKRRASSLNVSGVADRSRKLATRFVDDVATFGERKPLERVLQHGLVRRGIAHLDHRSNTTGDIVELLVHKLELREQLDQVIGQHRPETAGVVESAFQALARGWLRVRKIEPLDKIRPALQAGQRLGLGLDAFHDDENPDPVRELDEEIEQLLLVVFAVDVL